MGAGRTIFGTWGNFLGCLSGFPGLMIKVNGGPQLPQPLAKGIAIDDSDPLGKMAVDHPTTENPII
jgi:hypothetical protein